MPSIPSIALPHRARVVELDRAGPRDVQGERQSVEDPHPWFGARRMTPRPTKGDAEDGGGGRRRSEVVWTLLWGDEYEDGSPLDRPPRSSDLVDVERDGVATRYLVGPRPRELDTGEDVLGGQCDLLEVDDST